jgi:hypothetical protein
MNQSISETREEYQQNPENKELQDEFSRILQEEIIQEMQKQEIDKAQELLREFWDVASKASNNKLPSKLYAETVLRIMPIFTTLGTKTASKHLINNLRKLTDQSDDRIYRTILAKGLTNAVYDYSLKEDVASLREFLLELIDLGRKNPKDIEIQEATAKGLMNGITFFLKNRDEAIARKYYQRLKRLIERNAPREFVDSFRLQRFKEILE